MLEEIPADIECPLCMMVKDDMVECTKCSQASCRDCNKDFTTRSGKGNVNMGKFECTTCHTVNIMNPQNKILKEI